jgi:UDP-N-acetyl-D-galactosamine dehydrogenase
VNVLGLTFKENCADLRNSKVPDIVRELESFGIEVAVSDSLANPGEAMDEYGIELLPLERLPKADGLVLAVAHAEFMAWSEMEIAHLLKAGGVVIDVKSALSPTTVSDAGFVYWRL